jgi:FkbM family methyltransferase
MYYNKYSQYGEEVFLNNYFHNKIGLVVEIGAADGINNSNSRMLIENGWKALLVEPNIYNFKKLQELYKNNDYVTLKNVGCSFETKHSKFYVDHNDEYQQLSTFSESQLVKCKNMYNCEFEEIEIELVKTDDLFKSNNIKKIDFLSIDTEGYDENVIKGINFDNIEIDIICTEINNSILPTKGFQLIYQTVGNFFYKKLT